MRRGIFCWRFFTISAIWAKGSSLHILHLYPEINSCFIKGSLFLCLEATSFSPTGSDVAGGMLVRLLFLDLGAMLCKGTAYSLFFAQSLTESPFNVGSFFLKYPGPNKYRNPKPYAYACGLVDSAWFTAAILG